MKKYDGEFLNDKQYNILIFSSETCKECFALKQNYLKLENTFPEISFYEIDVNEQKEFAQMMEIYTLPSVIMFKKDKQIAEFKHGSYKTYENIEKFIKVYKEYNDNK